MSKKIILVVDDDQGITRLVSRVLSMMGHSVVTAGNGFTGLTEALEGAFDLIISDVQMPVMTGVGMVQALRKEGNTTPVLLMTGFAGDQADTVAAMAADGTVKGVMTKPFLPNDLREQLEKITF